MRSPVAGFSIAAMPRFCPSARGRGRRYRSGWVRSEGVRCISERKALVGLSPPGTHDEGDADEMTTTAAPAGTDHKVRDLALADFGRKEIQLAEHEMPGLMALRA